MLANFLKGLFSWCYFHTNVYVCFLSSYRSPVPLPTVSFGIQVRSTGIIDQVTRQPIKGRKRGGGIRFGEMERDSMLAHGAAYLLHDRLHTCSDYHIANVCSLCGSILTTKFLYQQKRVREIGGLPPIKSSRKATCHACHTSKGMETVAMPYVFRYLASELASMNIKMTLQVSNGAGAWGRQQFWHRGLWNYVPVFCCTYWL